MSKIQFKTKFFNGGKAIGAISEDGTVLAEWIQTTTRIERTGRGSYNIHRLAKGDNFETEDRFEFLGQHEEILTKVQGQLPKALVDAGWKVNSISLQDGWSVFNFLDGLAGGVCWFGNTPKNVIAACKRASKNMTFEI